MIPSGRVGRPCILGSSKLATEDDAKVSEGEYFSTLKSGLMSPATDMEPIEDRSANETLDLRDSPLVVTTVAVTSLFT
jgi:hypothetical protein